jgi:hypothetical protein
MMLYEHFVGDEGNAGRGTAAMARYLAFALVALLALPVLGAVYENNGSADGRKIITSVRGMGEVHDWEWGRSSEIQIAATRTASGRVSGTIRQVDLGSRTTVARVTCLVPTGPPGSHAIEVGGVVVSSYLPARGRGIQYIVDDLGAGNGAGFDRTAMGIGDKARIARCQFDPDPNTFGLEPLAGGNFRAVRGLQSFSAAADQLGRKAFAMRALPRSRAHINDEPRAFLRLGLDTWLLAAAACALLATGFYARHTERTR